MELQLNGFITRDYDDHPALIYNKTVQKYQAESIPSLIQDWANYQYLDEGLGKKITSIPDCCMRIWYTDDRCIFELFRLCQTLFGRFQLCDDVIIFTQIALAVHEVNIDRAEVLP